MKVAVYTIALNETAHVERWANSAAEADYRIVADTGSTDDTIDQLRDAGVSVHRIAVRPWRFDDARNTAMALIPADVDICCTMDMDMFLEPGWRSELEAAWTPDSTALYCRMLLRSSIDNPKPTHAYPSKSFHSRWGYRFKRPIHEALFCSGKEIAPGTDKIVMHHLRTNEANHERYIALMEVALGEDERDPQICFWLGREYMYANQVDKSIPLLERYLALPTSTWSDERSEAMRYMARMVPEERASWLDRARIEAPHRREIWLDLAEHFHSDADWESLFWACSNGIRKTRRTNSYLDDGNAWGFRLHDLGAIAAWRLSIMDLAVQWGTQALSLDPANGRLRNNLDFFERLREERRVAQ